MKTLKIVYASLLIIFVLAGLVAQAQNHPKGWSHKAKGAVIGGGAGAVTGAVIGGGKGAVIGAAAGVVGGGLIGRSQDKKKDPVRYSAYHKK